MELEDTFEVMPGMILKGYGAVQAQILQENATKSIKAVGVSRETPNGKYKEFRKEAIPATIELCQVDGLTYEGSTRTTDVGERMRELAPSAPKEIIEEALDIFNNITEEMDVINKMFKDYKPKNATHQGYIKHHFPSPKFPETSK